METCTIKKATNRKLHALLNATGNMPHKADLVSGYTNGRSDHSSAMLEYEALNLITYLEASKKDEEESCDKMRKKILAICHNMQWYGRYADGSLILHNSRPVLDFARINAFCKERGNGKKELQKYNSKELATLVTIFEKLEKLEAK